MTDNQTTVEAPPWIETTVRIATQKGDEETRGITNPLCPGLAVTMSRFGWFDVTHIASGRTVSRNYERCTSAGLALVQLAFCADWTKDGDELKASLDANGDEPCGFPGATVTEKGEQRPMTKRELFANRWRHMMIDEFPWEGDDSPGYRQNELLTLRASLPAAATQETR